MDGMVQRVQWGCGREHVHPTETNSLCLCSDNVSDNLEGSKQCTKLNFLRSSKGQVVPAHQITKRQNVIILISHNLKVNLSDFLY